MLVNVHSILHCSRANGPGARYVVWFQGCTSGCPGCFNLDTHDPAAGSEIEVGGLVAQILLRVDEIEGISISGGEPFQQPEALLEFVKGIRQESPLSILIFSGYTIEEILQQRLGPQILRHVDVLIDGRYVAGNRCDVGLLSSSNQRIHLLTDRYTLADFDDLPTREVIVHKDGTVTLTGVRPPRLSA